VHRLCLYLCVALVACGRSASEPAVSGRSTAPAPTTPAPSIDFVAGQFAITRLPALARDGSLVVVPVIENDGGRGFANLRVELRDRDDRLARRIDVMSVDEYETFVPDGMHGTAALQRRVLQANHALAALHAGRELVPMAQIKTDLAIDFAAHGWLAPQGQRCAQCPPCENPAYLDAVYQAAGSDVLLVRVAYRGTDLCWEPSPQYHVIVR
jgi:hypothetical protein